MILWRVSNHATLGGLGGYRTSGRWHTRGRPIVYCAENPATCLLEVLVHAGVEAKDLPITYQFLEIEAPETMALDAVPSASLPPDWMQHPESSRMRGDFWLEHGTAALLRVPCSLVPATWNVLINPAHPDARQLRLIKIWPFPLDRRLRR